MERFLFVTWLALVTNNLGQLLIFLRANIYYQSPAHMHIDDSWSDLALSGNSVRCMVQISGASWMVLLESAAAAEASSKYEGALDRYLRSDSWDLDYRFGSTHHSI